MNVGGDVQSGVMPQSQMVSAPPNVEDFTVAEALVWLGVSREDYLAAAEITRDNHGGPMMFALLAAKQVHDGRSDVTPAQVLARFDIDPADPSAAHRRYVHVRTAAPANQRTNL